MAFEDSKNFFKNFVFTFIRQIGVGIISLLTTILIARFFGPEINGVFSIAILLPILLGTFLNMGVAASNIYFIGSKQVSLEEAIHVNKIVFFWISLVGLIIGSIIVFFKGEFFFPGIEQNLLFLSLIIFPIILLSGFILSIYQALQDFKVFNILLMLQPLLFFFFVLSLIIIDLKEVNFLVYGFLLTYIISLIYMIVKIYSLPKEVNFEKTNYFKKSLGYGWRSNLSNILAFLNYKADIFLVNIFLNPTATGVYVVAVALVEKIWLISTALSTVLLPRLSELLSNEEEKRKITPYISRLVFLGTFIIGVFLALLAEPVILLIFGIEYQGSISPLLLLLPGVIILGVAKVWANDIAARGKPEINMYISIVTIIVNIIGNLILIPKIGLDGAAIATTISYLVCSIMTLIVYSRYSKTSWIDSLIIKLVDINNVIEILKNRVGR